MLHIVCDIFVLVYTICKNNNLTIINLSSKIREPQALKMNQTITDKKNLTRYRVTLDLMIDETSCISPEDWNWYNLLRLENREQVNDFYVENLGEYLT